MAAVPHHVPTPWPGHWPRVHVPHLPACSTIAAVAARSGTVRLGHDVRVVLVVLGFAVTVALLSTGPGAPRMAADAGVATTEVGPAPRLPAATPVAEPVTVAFEAAPTPSSAPATTPSTAAPTSTVAAAASHRSAAVGPSAAGVWQALAACETGGNWAARGGAFEGGLQFSPATWQAMGGTQFAAHAYLATPTQQVVVAERVRAANGGSYRAWPGCAARLGLP